MKKIVLILIGILSFSGLGILNPSDVRAQPNQCQITAVRPTSGNINTYVTLDVNLVPNRDYELSIELGPNKFYNAHPIGQPLFRNKSEIPLKLSNAKDFGDIQDRLAKLAEEKKKQGQPLEYQGKIFLVMLRLAGFNFRECEIPFTFLLTPPVPPLPPRPGPELVNCPSPFEKYGKTCIQTALGLIPTQPAGFTFWIFRWVIGIAGGIAFLLILIAAIVMTIGGSNPEGLKWANETMTNTLIGLVFIIFSVILLRLIGVDILGIPGFGR